MDGLRAGLAVVALHYAANLAHGIAHWGVPVVLTDAQTAFVVLVVGLAPVGSLWLVRQGRQGLAWASLAMILAASLLFGLAFHYLLDAADHVANVPSGVWHGPFVGTAALIALVDGGGGALSLWFAKQSS